MTSENINFKSFLISAVYINRSQYILLRNKQLVHFRMFSREDRSYRHIRLACFLDKQKLLGITWSTKLLKSKTENDYPHSITHSPIAIYNQVCRKISQLIMRIEIMTYVAERFVYCKFDFQGFNSNQVRVYTP